MKSLIFFISWKGHELNYKFLEQAHGGESGLPVGVKFPPILVQEMSPLSFFQEGGRALGHKFWIRLNETQ